MLNAQQRAKLRSIAQTEKDLVYIGQNNLTDNVLEQIKLNLYAHELIKIKVQRGASLEPKELANEICLKIGCETVGIIGNKILLYKKTTKPNFVHLI